MNNENPQTLSKALESIIIAEKALKDAKNVLIKTKKESADRQAKYRKKKEQK